jgi:hypothetical protein
MTVKLTDAQLAMLSAAAQREDHCLTAPDTLKGAVLAKVGEKLVKLGLVREVRSKAGAPVWRRDDVGSFALKLTAARLKAITVDDESDEAGAGREPNNRDANKATRPTQPTALKPRPVNAGLEMTWRQVRRRGEVSSFSPAHGSRKTGEIRFA